MNGEITRFDKRSGIYNSAFKTKPIDAPKDIDSIVPVGNKEQVDVLFAQFKDKLALEFINEVLIGEDHPVEDSIFGESVILTPEWAKSFAKAVNETCKPLFIGGHENLDGYKTRAIPDGYIVGASATNDKLVIRNRLFNAGKYGEAVISQTMSELRAGTLSTSTGDVQKREYEYNEDTGKWTSHVTESLKMQSNAIVEEDMAAADAHVVSSFRIGYYNEKNEFVSDENKLPSEVKENGMDLSEHISIVATGLKNGQVTSDALASAFGVKIITKEQESMLSKVADATKEIGSDAIEYALSMHKNENANFDKEFESALKEAFPNDMVYRMAELSKSKLTVTRTSQGIKDAIEALKKDDNVVSANKFVLGQGYKPSTGSTLAGKDEFQSTEG